MKISLRFKIISLILLVALILGVASILLSNTVIKDMIDDSYRNRANEIAGTVAAVLDPEPIAKLNDEVMYIYRNTKDRVGSDKWGTDEFKKYVAHFSHIEKKAYFKKLLKDIRAIQKENSVDCIYIVNIEKKTKKFIYLIDAALEDACPTGCYDPLYKQNEKVLTDPAVGFPAYITDTDEYGWLVTAGAPVYDKDGKVVAYAAVDISMDDIVSHHDRFLMWLIALEIVLTLIICVLAILFVNHSIIKPIHMLSGAAENYRHEEDQTRHNSFSEIDIHTGDELESLSKSMKQMERDINDNIANLIAVSDELTETRIRAESMNKLAKVDALTGIRNKLAYNEEIEKLEKERQAGFKEFGLAVVDLDGLKIINDTYGHDNGDAAIIALSEMICKVFAHSPVFRIGGDEFVVILKGQDYLDIDSLIGILNEMIEGRRESSYLLPWEKISASIGYAMYNPKTDEDINALFRRADQIMYEWKRTRKEACK